MIHTCLSALFIEHPEIVASVIYLFSIRLKIQNILPVRTSSLFSSFNKLKRKCRLSLPGVLLINSVRNRCINNPCATHKEGLGVAGSAFDGGWGTRWWRDVGGETGHKGWTICVGEYGKLGVHGDFKVVRSGSEMLDGVWNFSCGSCGVLDEEDT